MEKRPFQAIVRFSNGRLVYRGGYVFKVFAQNAYGPVDLAQPFSVRR